MALVDRVRDAWDCEECRRYRRAALAVLLLAVASWLFF
jgi:hypothetical protein